MIKESYGEFDNARLFNSDELINESTNYYDISDLEDCLFVSNNDISYFDESNEDEESYSEPHDRTTIYDFTGDESKTDGSRYSTNFESIYV